MRTREMPVVDLCGGPRERGRAYGESQRARIDSAFGHWFAALEQAQTRPPRAYVDAFLAATAFVPAIECWTPTLMEEIAGMAEGASVDRDLMLAFNLMDEEWWFGKDWRADEGGEGKHCSALGIAGQEGLPTFVAQTMDIAGWTDGHQVFLRHDDPDSGERSLVFTIAGMLGLNGMNGAGLAVCCNALLGLAHRRDGLPVQFLTRGVLGCASLDEAVAFVEEVPHASGQNYTIGAPGRVVSLECSANRVAAHRPGADADRVWHTNHAFANDDRAAWATTEGGESGGAQGAGAMAPTNSEIRYEGLTRRIAAPGARITEAVIKETLCSRDDPRHPISRAADPDDPNLVGFTAGAMIYNTLADDPKVELAAGPPHETDFMTFRFAAAAAQEAAAE